MREPQWRMFFLSVIEILQYKNEEKNIFFSSRFHVAMNNNTKKRMSFSFLEVIADEKNVQGINRYNSNQCIACESIK